MCARDGDHQQPCDCDREATLDLLAAAHTAGAVNRPYPSRDPVQPERRRLHPVSPEARPGA